MEYSEEFPEEGELTLFERPRTSTQEEADAHWAKEKKNLLPIGRNRLRARGEPHTDKDVERRYVGFLRSRNRPVPRKLHRHVTVAAQEAERTEVRTRLQEVPEEYEGPPRDWRHAPKRKNRRSNSRNSSIQTTPNSRAGAKQENR